jgi:RecA/RadA recombinase
MSVYYRKEIHRDAQKTNRELDKQMKMFSQITQDYKIPVLLTNQVYTDSESSERVMIGGNMMKNWSKKLLELTIAPRKLKILKPDVKETKIDITEKGLVLA